MNSYILIMAGGSGQRSNLPLPKQYYKLGSKTILQHTIAKFLPKYAGKIMVVISHEHEQQFLNLKLDVMYCFGGPTRQQSVLNGLLALQKFAPSKVLIHDAARPFISDELISNLESALKNTTGVLPVISVKDMARFEGKPIDRSKLELAQTPQALDFMVALECHQQAVKDAIEVLDDIALLEHYGHNYITILGSEDNFKITTSADIKKAERLMEYEYRIGSGFDVHRFTEETGDLFATLGGIKIPHTHGVIAHSDGDVILHALTDALLGACGKPDIGTYFPPSDNRWKNADSSIFVLKAMEILDKELSGKLINVDITLMCEKPRIKEHREAIISNLAKMLNIKESAIAIKATTTEGLGFLGRREGLAASCNVMVKVIE